MEGVVRTSVGYAGGSKKEPTYYNLGDHSETVQIEYDPDKVSYEGLLVVFWSSHDPVFPSYSGQYKSIIFYHNEEQRELALETLEREEERLGKKIYTEIVPYAEFYLAENYHQKYYLRSKSQIATQYEAIYPDQGDFIASTAVARLNGYLGGYGSREQLEQDAVALGLWPSSLDLMRKLVSVTGDFCAQ